MSAPKFDGVTFEVLGPVRAFHGSTELALGPVRQRAVLAVLLLRPGATCSSAEIIAAVWGHRPPRTSLGLVRTYVSRLRRVLGKDSITSGSTGYLMRVTPERIDALHLEQQLGRVRQMPDAADRIHAAAELHEALSRWRGAALDGIPGPFAQAQRTRLAALRCAALEECLAAELASRIPVDALPRFRAAVAEYPTHEGLVGLLMTALYRSGRQADALTEFRQLRERLFDRHGAAPGPELTALHDAVLRSDRRLADVRWDGRTVLPERAGHALPGDLPLVVGRREQIALLLDGLTCGGGGAGVVAIEGVAGAGKSALAVHLAHRVAERYPDGQLFLDLGGAHHESSARMSVETARTALLRALGADPAASSVAWRELLAHRRLLLVLDNAADAEQVRALLPGHPGCGAVVTSRTSLAALGAAATVSLPGRIDAAAVALQELLGEAAAQQKVGGYQEAEAWLHEARRRAERSGLVEALPLIHVRLAQLQHCHRRYADGLASAHEALTLAHRQDDRHLAAQALYALGDVEITRGRLDTAAEFLHGAHVAAVELGERHVAALALGALGTVAGRSGDLTAAFDSHRQATAALAGADPAPVSVDLALRLAETHRAAGHPQEAEALVRSCLELAEHTADLRDTARALSELARCLPASSEAQLYNARATAILRRLGVDEPAVESGRTAPGARLRQALGSR